MNNEIKVEEWNGYDIRFVLHEGEWWAVLADICKPLGLDAYDIKRQLGDGPVNTRYVSDALGRRQKMLVVNENGIYKAIFKSRKPEAEAFQDWVCDILKLIRKQSGLEGYEVFMMTDREFQKNQMVTLDVGLGGATTPEYCKANRIANKAVSNVFGFEKSISKDDMTVPMLRLRQPVLEYAIYLMIQSRKFGYSEHISQNVYKRAYELYDLMFNN